MRIVTDLAGRGLAYDELSMEVNTVLAMELPLH